MAFTKIVATVGPACDTVGKLARLISEGVSVFRFNLKHNTQKWHSIRIKRVEEAAMRSGQPVATLLDFQGPEIRIGDFPKNKALRLHRGDTVYFVTASGTVQDKEIVLNNLELLQKLTPGQEIRIDAGAFVFEVTKNEKDRVATKVVDGGVLTGKKNVHVPGIELSLPTLAKKDLEDITFASREKVDYAALSYVREKKDIEVFRHALTKQQVDADVIAKIETKQAMNNLDEIIASSDGVMVARGDLGVEFPLEQVPYLQKEIIKKCLKVGRPVITATQMLESMTGNPQPTRAEVSDVANAVYDRTDCLMLSAESAIGKYPERSVAMMRRTAEFTEKQLLPTEDVAYDITHQTAAITYGAYQLLQSEFCQKRNIKAFVVLTETGMTGQMLSRLRPNLPIVALTRHRNVADKLALVWGVVPIVFDFGTPSMYEKKESSHIQQVLRVVKMKKIVKKGDKVIMMYGENWGTPGKTSVIRIQEV